MNKFKVGDRVKVVSNDHRPHHHFGAGTVAEIRAIEDDRTLICLGGSRFGFTMHQYVNVADVVPVDERRKIVVTADGKTTTAKLFNGKELVKSAEAKCSLADEFDFKIGATLALDRLLGREKKAEPEKLFPLEEIKAGYLLKIRDDNGDEYFMTVVPNRDDKLGCCNIEKPAYWLLEKFGSELRYADSCVIGIWGRAYNDDLLKNSPDHRTLLWSRK